jgi:hypothetical protein
MFVFVVAVSVLTLSVAQTDTTPFVVLTQVETGCVGLKRVQASLANYQNKVKSVYFKGERVIFESSVFNSMPSKVNATGGSVVNFPANVMSNSPAGACDSFVTAGNLGLTGVEFFVSCVSRFTMAGVVVDAASSQWSAIGVEVQWSFRNSSNLSQQVLLSCGFPQGGLSQTQQPYPSCPENDFYQTLSWISVTGSPTLSVRWSLLTIDSVVISGFSNITFRLFQNLSFTSVVPSVATFGGMTYTATAVATSNLTVTISSTTNAVCTANSGIVSFVGVGTCTLSASQAGNSVYLPGEVQQSFLVSKSNQALSFSSSAPVNAVVQGSMYSPVAVSSSGLMVAITSGASSVCTINGGVVSFVGAGTCVLNANQAGNAYYNAAMQVQQSFSVGKGSQSITFTSSAPGAALVGGPNYAAAATSTAGLSVTLTGSSSVCTISSGVVSFQASGTCTLIANQPGDANYKAAPQVQQSFSVGPGVQTISFTSTAPATAGVGGTTYIATASSSSGLPVTLTLDTSVCAISSGTVSFISTGTCTIRGTQPGNSNFQAANPVTQSFTVAKGAQMISFTSTVPAAAQVGGSPLYVPVAVSTSGLAVSVGIDGASASVCSISGGSVSYIGVGTCTVVANQAGNSNFNAADAAIQSFMVSKGAQTISFSSSPPSGAQIGGATYSVSAVSTSGLVVAITVDASSASVCTISGNLVSFTGSGTCLLNGDQSGNINYLAAARVQQSFGVGLQLQTVSFSTIAPSGAVFGGAAYAVAASATSGLHVIIATSTPAVCTTTAGLVSFVGVGTCTLNANQAGSSTFNAAALVQQSFTVSKAAQSVTFSSLAPTNAVVAGANYVVSVNASSGLPVLLNVDVASSTICSVAGSVVSFQSVGSCLLVADQAGNSHYNAASQVRQSFSVGKGSQSIAFSSSAPAALVGGQTYVATASSSAGLAVTLTVSTGSLTVCSIAANGVVSFQTAGICVLNANQPGDLNYNAAAQVQQSFSVGPGLQTISFTSVPSGSASVGGATYSASATASSGLPVSFTSDSPSVCSILLSTVSFVSAGTCTIRGTQTGNSNFQAATPVTQSFTVAKGTQTISFISTVPAAAQVGGTPLYVPVASSTSGLSVTISVDAASSSVCSISSGSISYVGVGTCTIVANQVGNVNYNAAIQVVQSLVISKGFQTITFSSVAPPGAQVGGSVYVVAAVSTSGLAVSVTVASTSSSVCAISGNTVSFLGNGTCLLYGDQSGNTNYLAATRVEQTFGVGLQLQTVSFLSAPPAAAVFGGLSYTPTVTSSSGLPVALSSSTLSVCSVQSGIVSFVGVGTCTVNANQPGSSSFNAAPQVQQSFAVSKAGQTVGFNSLTPANARVGGTPYNVSATSSSGLPVSVSVAGSSSLVCSLSGDVVTFQSTGTCSLIGIQAGSSNYNAAVPVTQDFTVSKGTQTLVFTSSVPAGALAGGSTYMATVSTSSGLPVVFSVDNLALSVCSVGSSSGIVSFLGTGTCILIARQSGNSNFEPAADVTQFFGGRVLLFVFVFAFV